MTDRRDSGFGPWRRGRGGPSRPGDDSVDPAEGRDTPDPQSDTRYGLHGPQYGDTADEYPTEHIRRPIRPRGAPTPPPPPPPPAPGPRRAPGPDYGGHGQDASGPGYPPRPADPAAYGHGRRGPGPSDHPGHRHPGMDNYPPPAPGRGPAPRRRPELPPLRPGPGRPDYDAPPRYDDPLADPSADAPTEYRPRPEAPADGDPHPGGAAEASQPPGPGRRGRRTPKKITVTRVAAMRSRELTQQGFARFQQAATADGAGKSGLTALIYAYMANFATDAALTVALANTLFITDPEEGKLKVALYLLVTLAPFAVIAPLIGPALDRLQRGRRLALAASFVVRVVLAILLALNFDSWLLYPAALGMLVMSKSFAVLKSAITPRVMPPGMDLVRVNSRLQVFGLVGGTTVAGGIAAAVAALAGSAGALILTAVFAVIGAYLSMQIPSWVEVTEGEIATTFTYHGEPAGPAGSGDGPAMRTRAHGGEAPSAGAADIGDAATTELRQPLGHNVLTGMWGTASLRMMVGFLFLFIPFMAAAHSDEGTAAVLMIGVVALAGGAGNIIGNGIGTRLKMDRPAVVVVAAASATTVFVIIAAITASAGTVAVAALVANMASALSKVSLDASIQNDLPDASRASAFGRSETVLQLSWVFGGALGVLLPTEYWIGFTVMSGLLAVGLAQTVMIFRGSSLIPVLRGKRPDSVPPEQAGPARARRRVSSTDDDRGPTDTRAHTRPDRPRPDTGRSPRRRRR